MKQETEQQVENKEEEFDLNFALMTGELSLLLADLVKLLGGEKLAETRA